MVPGLSGAILAAGRGERLRAASGGVPKPLVEVGGEALIVRQYRALAALGASPVHVIVNVETAAMMHERGLRLPPSAGVLVRDTPNSMESLLALGERIGPGRFLMTTVDAMVAEAELARFLDTALAMTDPTRSPPLDGALGVVKWRGERHPLFTEVAADGAICRLGGQPTHLVTAGVYLLPTRIFTFAGEARSAGLDALRRYLALLIERGMNFAAIELDGVIDIDEAADLDAARILAARRGS